jgi:LPS-assembly lipoprotein
MRTILNSFLMAVLLLLAGCGFQLRGESQLPFISAYVDAPEGSVLGPALRKALAAQRKLAAQAKGAQVLIRVLNERRLKDILTLSGGGKVLEYRLTYKVTLKVTDDMGSELIAPVELQQQRDFTYSDSLSLAKEAEEAALNRAMEQDALQQALRRLSYLNR